MTRIFNLASWFQKAVTKYKEDKRQMSRQKVMRIPGALVLFPDFLKAAVDPAMKNQGKNFAATFGVRGKKIEENLYQLVDLDKIPAHFLVFDALSDESQKNAANYIEAAIKEVTAYIESQEKNLEADEELMAGGLSVADYKANLPESLRQEELITAFFLRDIMFAMDRCWQSSLTGQWMGIKRYELSSLVRGQGHHVGQFWQDVNNLEDYRRLIERPRNPAPGPG